MKKKSKRVFALVLCIIYLGTMFFTATGCTDKNVNVDNDTNDTEDDTLVEEEELYTLKLVDEIERVKLDVPYKPTNFTTEVKPYNIKNDLSNIENLEQFGEFSKDQIKNLVENGFVVNPAKWEQIFYVYEKNEYLKIPSFITTDSVLQVYHVFYDYSLRNLEKEKLLTNIEELTESMLNKSIYIYEKLQNEELKNIGLKSIAYFAVSQLTLEKDMPDNIPKEAKDIAQKEYEFISNHEGFKDSNIFSYQLDYSQYVPRGHYTRSDELKRYFKTMMWYGQTPFPLYIEKDGVVERAVEQTLQAVLITYSMFLDNDQTNDVALWESIYDPTDFYVGNADDLDIYHYKDLIMKAYGENPDINSLNDKEKLDILYKEADKLPEPKIQGKYTTVTTPVGKQFRFMGQRYVPDSYIIQNLVKPIIRPIPSGLDVMGVIGSDRAYDVQINQHKVAEEWPEYPQEFEKLKTEFDDLEEETWTSNMYYGWMWTLKGLLREFSEGYPSFMTNKAWADKSLTTALGSWAELKHDTVLYGKQSGAECGGGIEPPEVKGYVEPNIEVYEKLLWLTGYSMKNLEAKGVLTDKLKRDLDSFDDLLTFLINCSVKELRNEELSEDEYLRILNYGGMLEYLTSSLAGDGLRWFEITNETDKNMAVVSDIHTVAPNQYSDGGYFEVGVGPAYEIYVVVPIDGKLYLTRGGVFSYYEFLANKRLTDEEWQDSLKNNNEPPQPKWMGTYIKGGKKDIPIPEEPYDPGC